MMGSCVLVLRAVPTDVAARVHPVISERGPATAMLMLMPYVLVVTCLLLLSDGSAGVKHPEENAANR